MEMSPGYRDLDDSWNHRLISNRGAPPLEELATRHERADVLLLDGRVHFVFYKKIAQLVHFRPGDQWFDDDARRAIHAQHGKP